MRGLAQGEGSGIRFRMITAGEFHVPTKGAGGAAAAVYRRVGVSNYRCIERFLAVFRAVSKGDFWGKTTRKCGFRRFFGGGTKKPNELARETNRRVGVSAWKSNPRNVRKGKIKPPLPSPMASQGRHESVAQYETCGCLPKAHESGAQMRRSLRELWSRNVVLDRGAEGEELDGNYFYDSEPFHKFCSRTVRPFGQRNPFGFWLRFHPVCEGTAAMPAPASPKAPSSLRTATISGKAPEGRRLPEVIGCGRPWCTWASR